MYDFFYSMSLERLTGVIESGYYLKTLLQAEHHLHKMIQETSEGRPIKLVEIPLPELHAHLENQLYEMEKRKIFGLFSNDYYVGYTASLDSFKDMIMNGQMNDFSNFLHITTLFYYFANKTFDNLHGEGL